MATWATPLKNQLPANAGAAVVAMVNFLLGLGYTIPAWTDGTTWALNNTPGTIPFTGTQWQNNNWLGFILQDPAGEQITLQRDATSFQNLRVLAGPKKGFRDVWIQFPAAASITNAQTATLGDGSTSVVFTYWKSGGAPANPIDIRSATTAADVAAAAITAFTAASSVAMTYVNSGSGLVYCVKTTRSGYGSFATTNGSTTFAPSGTKMPVAYGDGGIVQNAGGGTDQSPTAGSTLLPYSGATYLDGVATNAAPWAFCIWGKPAGNNVATCHLMVDRAINRYDSVSSYHDGVYAVVGANALQVATLSKETAAASGYIGNANNATWGGLVASFKVAWASSAVQYCWPWNISVNVYDNADCPKIANWYRTLGAGSPPFGWKGESTILAWTGAGGTYGALLDGVAAGERTLQSNTLMPGWDNTVVS